MKPLRNRLAAFKAAKAEGRARCGHNPYYSAFRQPGWRNGDYPYTHSDKQFGLGGDGNRGSGDYSDHYFCHGEPNLRGGQEAHKVASLRHTGWYADNYQDLLYVGVVYQLSGARGAERWVAGYHDKDAGTVTLDIRTVYDEARDAALAADALAECEAGKSREFYAKDDAERDIEEARGEIHRINGECLALIRETRGKTFTTAICSALQGTVRGFLRERAEQFRIIEERQENFWSAVPE
ncbi:hypothetical protein D9M70_325110 [compost metagenome]